MCGFGTHTLLTECYNDVVRSSYAGSPARRTWRASRWLALLAMPASEDPPSKIKPGLSASDPRVLACVQILHMCRFGTHLTNVCFDEPRSFNHRFDSERKTWSPFRTRHLALSLRIEVSKPLSQSSKLTRFKIPLFFCAHSHRSATASANFVPTGVRV